MAADYSPFAYAIEWRRILDFTLLEFFTIYNDDFSMDKETGKFFYSGNTSKYKLKKFCESVVADLLSQLVDRIKKEKPAVKHVYIIETCRVNDNIINLISPKKTENRLNLSYELIESDVVVDLTRFEDIFSKIFCDYFSGKKTVPGFKFVKHKNFKSKTIMNLIRQHYGAEHFKKCNWRYFKSLFAIYSKKPRKVLADLNDALTVNKKQLTKHENLISCKLTEIKQFLGFV